MVRARFKVKGRDQSLRSPLKVAIIPTFRAIVVQVRILRLKRAKMAFSAEIYLLEMAFLPFSTLFPQNSVPNGNILEDFALSFSMRKKICLSFRRIKNYKAL